MIQKFIEQISVNELKELTLDYGVSSVFLITGKNSYQQTGAKALIEESFCDIQYTRFSDFDVNPKIEDIERGVTLFKAGRYDMIVAIGGGSVIDTAKCINVFQSNTSDTPLDIVKHNRVKKKGVPLIAIPTTAGSGSEATHFAVVYIDKQKYSLAHAYLLPDVVALNYNFTLHQSKYLTACVGFDALSQAIESFWSVGATDISKKFAEQAIVLLMAHLEESVLEATVKSKKAVMLGAYYAGKAINISKTTAPHAISYAFTTYFSIPHGHAVFLTLPQFIEYNASITEADSNEPRGVDYVKMTMQKLYHLLKVSNAMEASILLKKLAQNCGVELSLEKLGIKDCEVLICNNVNLERIGNNPRKISSILLLKLLKQDYILL